MVASKNDQRVVDHVSMPTDGAVIFPEHHNLNYSTGMADTPEINSLDQFHSNLFQQSSEEHSRVQLEMMENDLFAHTEDVILAYSACNGNASPPFTFWDSADDHSKTSTMLPPHSQETITQPSTITSDLLQADALQDLPVCPTANQSMTSSHPPLQRSMTDGSISVAQNKTPEQLTSVQKPDRETYSPQTDSSNAKSAPVQHNLPSAEPDTTASAIHAKTSADAQTAFSRLVPLLQTAHSGNVSGILLEVIKKTHRHVSLSDVFCMLYSGDTLEGIHIPGGKLPDMNKFSEERLIGIKLQHLVRESFRIPQTFQNGLFQHSMLPTVNFHEFLRNFLAMKILYGSLRKVEDSSQTLSRLSVYKVYYILCHKLTKTHSHLSNCVSSPRQHFLGQPKIGGLTKLIHPDLAWKRLGKRGHSKVHYVGLTWNESTVDKDTLGLLDLHVTDLSEYFKRGTNPLKPSLLPRSRVPQRSQGITNQQITPIPMQSSPFKPLSSFVDLSCKYPDCDCSPRNWKMTPNMVPKQSEWAKVTMKRSLDVLKGQGVNLDPLMARINAGDYSSNDEASISGTVIQSIKVLWNVSASNETYFHFYLAVILLLLPVIVASDQEVPKVSKAQIRASMKDCVMKLENEVATFASIDTDSVTFFSRNLRKMIHISEMTSCAVKRSDTKSVFKEILSDFQQITNKGDGLRGMSACEELFISGAVKGMNAFSLNMSESSFVASHASPITNIVNIGKTFQDVSLSAMSTLVSLSSSIQDDMTEKDVGYQVFHLSARLFHQMTLTYPEISHLPIRIISFIISYFFNEMQRVSFAEFAKRDPGLSQETFKSWWIYSSMFQEYMDVMSEVVALSQNLV